MQRALVLLLLSIAWPQHTFAQTSRVGIRDHLFVGITAGAPTAVVAAARIVRFDGVALTLDGFFGAGVATWGIAESYGGNVRLEAVVSNDNENDALLLQPAIGVGMMLGDYKRSAWLDFAPYVDVNFITSECALAWVHEYQSCSLALSLAPGIALALNGRDKNDDGSKNKTSLQLHFGISFGFWRVE